MLPYFTNRRLARCLSINLARWKRWSRAFLPPDPLGGRQSGYARQYHPNDAWRVYWGGHLVAFQNLSIPFAGRVLDDLDSWLATAGFAFDPQPPKERTPLDPERRPEIHLHILAQVPWRPWGQAVDSAEGYLVERVEERRPQAANGTGWEQRSRLLPVGVRTMDPPDPTRPVLRRVALTALLVRFAAALDVAPVHYAVLCRPLPA